MARVNILSAILDFILMFLFHYHRIAWPWKHKFCFQNEQYISYATQVMIIYRLFDNGGFGANLLPVLISCRMATKDIHILLLFLKILVYDTVL